MEINIRPAKLLDINTIDYFQNGIGIYERPLDPYIKKKGKIRYYTLSDIKTLIKSRNAIILIAEINNKSIACGFGEIKKNRADWSKLQHKGCVGMMFVEKRWRGRGIGSMILKNLLKWFEKNKIKDIRLQVYENNAGAARVYKKQGFKNYLLEMVYRPD